MIPTARSVQPSVATQVVGRPTVRPPAKRRSSLRLGWSLLMLLFLTASYDKSGIVIGTTSVSIYKMIWMVLIVIWLMERLTFTRRRATVWNRKVYRWLVFFVVVQTAASLIAELFGYLPPAYSSEVYFFLQRSAFLVVPLIALSYNVPPKTLLKVLLTSVLLHYGFVLLQYVSVGAYNSFSTAVADHVRQDNGMFWDGSSVDFIGLQRTSNYGVFVAAFGLLVLGLQPRSRLGMIALVLIAMTAVALVALGPSRSALILVVVALCVWVQRRGWLSHLSSYPKIAISGIAIVVVFLALGMGPDQLTSYNAFFDPEREGSNLGKLGILDLGVQLFRQSPTVGHGARRFADLTGPLGNESAFMSEAHSYTLSTLVSSGAVGLGAYVVVWIVIARALWRARTRECAIVCGLFIGLGFYNVVYDAGGLDFFAAFNGVAAYYALTSLPAPRRRPDLKLVTATGNGR